MAMSKHKHKGKRKRPRLIINNNTYNIVNEDRSQSNHEPKQKNWNKMLLYYAAFSTTLTLVLLLDKFKILDHIESNWNLYDPLTIVCQLIFTLCLFLLTYMLNG